MQKNTNTNTEKEYKESHDLTNTTVTKPSWADIAAGRSKPVATTTVTHKPPVYHVENTSYRRRSRGHRKKYDKWDPDDH
jgi:hypothetical protein